MSGWVGTWLLASLTHHIWTCVIQNVFELAFIYFFSAPPLLKLELLFSGKAEFIDISSLCLAIILRSTYHLNTCRNRKQKEH